MYAQNRYRDLNFFAASRAQEARSLSLVRPLKSPRIAFKAYFSRSISGRLFI